MMYITNHLKKLITVQCFPVEVLLGLSNYMNNKTGSLIFLNREFRSAVSQYKSRLTTIRDKQFHTAFRILNKTRVAGP